MQSPVAVALPGNCWQDLQALWLCEPRFGAELRFQLRPDPHMASMLGLHVVKTTCQDLQKKHRY